MERETIIVGNWKMYKTAAEAARYIQELAPLVQNCDAGIYLAVPFTAIESAAVTAKEAHIVIGAQNMNDVTEGAFTGEIAARMLKEAGAEFVLLGHSERRHIFNEDNTLINRKVLKALDEDIRPIFCFGETLEERKDNLTEEVLTTQIMEGLNSVGKEQIASMIIAYEPVWAIGTDETATPKIAGDAHKFVRNLIKEHWGKEIADKLVMLYGGSVKPENAQELLDQPDIDGLLVGGASLQADAFAKITTVSKRPHPQGAS